MPASFIPVGTPAQDAERQALQFLVDGLPADCTVFGNPWLVERGGAIYEVDAVVVTPRAIFVVEIKSWRGRIEGTDTDWWIPEQIRSPLQLNRKTAQVLNSQLRRASWEAGQAWIEGYVFLSSTLDVGVRGPASNDRVHTRRSIIAALTDTALVDRLSNGRGHAGTSAACRELISLFNGVQASSTRPLRRVREYEVVASLEHHDTFSELLGRNAVSEVERVLRIYALPPLATEAERARVTQRARWESQVLCRLGRIDGVLSADPPFTDESGIVLPMEHFRGITLASWVDRHGPFAPSDLRADLRARVALWLRLARTLDDAHGQGVVHRLLRPEAVLVTDDAAAASFRVTGFDLAKQTASDATVAFTSIADDRLVFAAPEVIAAFSSAEPASDQFSLGALLAHVVAGKPIFDSTRELMTARRLARRLRDVAPRVPLSLDEAVSRMLSLRPADRFPSLKEAIDAVRLALEVEPRTPPVPAHLARGAVLDVDNLEAGVRVTPDYEIVGRLGQGGLSIVYAARHLVSGRVRALKIASSNDPAEDALRREYDALSRLDHANIVRVIDLTKMVEGRLTLVMERVGSQSLRQWLAADLPRDLATRRRLAEDLLAGLDALEQHGVTHKDLKPENLLVHEGRLTIIDFSLAGIPDDSIWSGTALFRDPAAQRWTHGTDRYAAAICLFELYAGRHPFDGHAPQPDVEPLIADDDLSPSGLARFFRAALSPDPARRHPSAVAMRDALLLALGDDRAAAAAPIPDDALAHLDASTPLRQTALPSRARNALARGGLQTVGELLALTDAQIRAIHALGSKTAADVLAFRDALRARGLTPSLAAAAASANAAPPIFAALVDAPEPLGALNLPEVTASALAAAHLLTVGAVASAPRAALLALRGFGTARLGELVRALGAFAAARATDRASAAPTLDRVWDAATAALSDLQRAVLGRSFGLEGEIPGTQTAIAATLGLSQPQLSAELGRALEGLAPIPLRDLELAVETFVAQADGIAALPALAERVERDWPAGIVTAAGLIRLIVRRAQGRLVLHELDGLRHPVIAWARFDSNTLRTFVAEVVRLASQWPLVESETARRALAAVLPDYAGDPLSLGCRLCDDVGQAESGHIFIGPLDADKTLRVVLDQARAPIPLDRLEAEVFRVFGPATPFPTPEHLPHLLARLDCVVHDGQVVPGRLSSLVAPPPLSPDALPPSLLSERSPEEVTRDMLREAARSRGFRLLVAPPERHHELARSVAAALGARWVSFEDAFFGHPDHDLADLERAERFAAQREALTEAAEATLQHLLETHGAPGRAIVLGDLALLGLCDAIDLPRRLYDETLSGRHGFWIVVVPGVIHKRQPRFNEDRPMWHLEGATLPLLNPLPPPAA